VHPTKRASPVTDRIPFIKAFKSYRGVVNTITSAGDNELSAEIAFSAASLPAANESCEVLIPIPDNSPFGLDIETPDMKKKYSGNREMVKRNYGKPMPKYGNRLFQCQMNFKKHLEYPYF
jgi:hypothetical protein